MKLSDSTIPSLVITVVAIIGLVVLVALNKVSGGVAVPIIATLAGVHIGVGVTPTSDVPTAPVTPPPVFK